jgi:hypothetical protein
MRVLSARSGEGQEGAVHTFATARTSSGRKDRQCLTLSGQAAALDTQEVATEDRR